MRLTLTMKKTILGICLVAPLVRGVLAGPAEPERLDFGPFELASPAREARVKLGADETKEVRAAVAELLADIQRRTGVKLRYSSHSSPIGGDVFVSTQPWAATGA